LIAERRMAGAYSKTATTGGLDEIGSICSKHKENKHFGLKT
jgi:hypothetical protein